LNTETDLFPFTFLSLFHVTSLAEWRVLSSNVFINKHRNVKYLHQIQQANGQFISETKREEKL